MISAPLARAASTNFFTFGTEAAQRGRRAGVQVCTVKSMTRSAVVLASSVTGLSCGGAGSFALYQSSMMVVSACAGRAAAPAKAAAIATTAASEIDLRYTCPSPYFLPAYVARLRAQSGSTRRPGQSFRRSGQADTLTDKRRRRTHQRLQDPGATPWPQTTTLMPSIAALFSAPLQQAWSGYPP